LEYISFEHNNIATELVKQFYDTPPLAFVHSYGCQQNVNDGERIKGVLMDIGYGLCDKPEDADLILFNTCAVREHAEQRVFGNVGALKGLKEKKHDLIIGLCGCMANQKHVVEKLRQSYPYVDLVFGVDGIDTLPQLIAQKLQKHKRVLMEPAQRPVIVENIPSCTAATTSVPTASCLMCAAAKRAASPVISLLNSAVLWRQAIRRSHCWDRTSTATARVWKKRWTFPICSTCCARCPAIITSAL
jgi:hypothetical protein